MSRIFSNHRIGAAVWRSLLITATLLILAGCGGSKYNLIKGPEYTDHSARSLAIAPSDSLFSDGTKLADAIGAELTKRGFSVFDTNRAAAVLVKYDAARVDARAPQALAAFSKEGIDAVLTVSSVSADIGGPSMRHVKLRVISTRTTKEIGGVDWDNSWGGLPGSPADYMSRKGTAGAAQEIAEALAKLLG